MGKHTLNGHQKYLKGVKTHYGLHKWDNRAPISAAQNPFHFLGRLQSELPVLAALWHGLARNIRCKHLEVGVGDRT